MKDLGKHIKDLVGFTITSSIILFAILVLASFCFPLPSDAGLWEDMKRNYKEGRQEASDARTTRKINKEIDQRYDELWREAMRKRLQQERHMHELTKGFKTFLSKGHTKFYIVGGVGLLVYLCHRGAVGCVYDWDKDRRERRRKERERKQKEKSRDEKDA